MHVRTVRFVGVSGPSGVGKSTLAKGLANALHSPVQPIHLDWYLKPPKGSKCWETPDVVHWTQLLDELSKLKEHLQQDVLQQFAYGLGKNPVEAVAADAVGKPLDQRSVTVVVEGFLLFYDARVARMLDLAVWLEADLETCRARRESRNKKRSDKEEFARWFREEVWGKFCEYRQTQLDNSYLASKRIEVIDAGNVRPKDILQRVFGNFKDESQSYKPERLHDVVDADQQPQGRSSVHLSPAAVVAEETVPMLSPPMLRKAPAKRGPKVMQSESPPRRHRAKRFKKCRRAWHQSAQRADY